MVQATALAAAGPIPGLPRDGGPSGSLPGRAVWLLSALSGDPGQILGSQVLLARWGRWWTMTGICTLPMKAVLLEDTVPALDSFVQYKATDWVFGFLLVCFFLIDHSL